MADLADLKGNLGGLRGREPEGREPAEGNARPLGNEGVLRGAERRGLLSALSKRFWFVCSTALFLVEEVIFAKDSLAKREPCCTGQDINSKTSS